MTIKTGNPLSLGTYHAVMLWFSPTRYDWQIDGGAVSGANCTFTQASGSMLFSFTASFGVAAVVDGIAVWNRNLLAKERAAWYNGGAGVAYPFS
jgi:hypothetical protein